MKHFIAVFIGLALTLPCVNAVSAQDADQAVNVVVPSVSVVDVSGDPATMTFGTVNGANFDSVTDATTTYGFAHNNAAAQKIVATLSTAYTGTISLTINLVAPAGGFSPGAVLLVAATGVDVVTGIPAVAQAGMTIEYVATASASEPQVDETKTVTFTIVAN